MRNLLLLFALLISTQSIHAQNKCGFDSYLDDMMKKDTAGASYTQRANARWSQQQAAMLNNGRTITTGYGTEYEIPVVVHIIHTGQSVGTTQNPTDATVQAVIDDLNKVFEATHTSYQDTNNGGVRFPVKFVLAKRTSACGSTNGINRVNGSSLTGYAAYGVNRSATGGADDEKVKALSRWDSREYYNIWVVTEIDSNDGTSGSFTAGYAQFPGFTDTTDGTVILAQYFKTNETVLAHEIGHAFYLYHTFQGDNNGASCPSNTSCSTQGDLVCDTEPHKRNASTCPSNSATNTCTGTTWGGAHRNFMDYNSCPDIFTDGQRTRFLQSLINDRPGLANSQGGVAPPSTTTASASCTTTINTGLTQGTTNMGPVLVTLNDLSSNSGGYYRDQNKAYIDRTCTQWAHLTQGQSYTISVNTETNLQDVQAYIDYSNNGAFVTAERVMNHNTALSANGPETHSNTFTVPTSGVTTCTPLRMRVVADWYGSTHVTNGCGQLDYGQAEDFTVYIKNASDTVTMFNTITAGSNPTCTTGSVTFTASASKSLSGVSYQWYRNSQPVGSNSSTYSVSSLSAGTYYVKCKVKYTNGCSVTDSMMTNEIALVVNTSTVTPSVSIVASPSNSICSGTSVTFTATPTNGGTSPTYQWKVNGGNVTGSGNQYTSSSLSNSDVVSCVMTSNASCVSSSTANSNNITMTVTPNVTPSVNISANPGSSICSGTSVTFTATPTNGGTSPSYQWKVNGGNVTGSGNQYTSSSLSNSDVVSCVMTSNASCATSSTANSNNITMTVTTSVTPSVTIAANPGNSICSGTSVTFTATPTNGGTPSYQWKVNGSNVTGTGNQYTSTTLSNNDVVSCVMTSSITCVTSATANSNNITMTVTPTVTPSVTIGANPGNSICSGTSVTFTATPTNGGTSPTYQWKVNGGNVTGSGNQYTSTTLSNNDVVSCVMTSNASCATSSTANSNNITMTVTPNVTPSVTIAANPGNSICAGTSLTFTATPTNGGTPTYQWKVNGSNVTGTGNQYTSTTLSNNDVVSCVMTSSVTCVTSATANSNNITMTVTPNVTPSVSIVSNQGSSICTGTSVTFTATPTNGGTSPTYQWKVNGSNVTGTGNQYTSTTLSNNDVVSCVMTSNAICATSSTANSNNITMTVTTTSAPSVTIAANPGNSICSGTSVTFTATPTNGGTSPTYQWKVNGSNVTGTGNQYTSTTLSNSDVVSCVMTSNSPCATPTTATSNNITMTVTPNVTPSVTIATNTGSTICSGTSVTFTATPTNGGTPTYQWKVNGSNVTGTGNQYISSSLSNNDIVSCVMTSSLACVTSATANSNNITMTVTTTVTPSVSIAAAPGNSICAGTSVTFTATPTNGGTSPTYQWKVNGSNVTGTGNQYTSTTLANNDVVSCVMTSNATCATSSTATSNNVTMTVTTPVTPSVTIAAVPGNNICAGTSVTFTATPTNGGTPTYQWKVNGSNVTGTGNQYTSTTLSNTDVVSCVMTSSLTCVTSTTATSNNITMTVTPIVTPSVTIGANPGNTICSGTSVTFTATPTNGGTTPTYQWKVNGSNVTGTGNQYTSATLSNNDIVTCEMTSSLTCVTTSTATSNSITMTVGTNLTPSVSIAANPGSTICSGTSVTFTATPTNGGASPTYQWKVNGSNVAGTGNQYTSTTLSNNDIVTCEMTSSLTCVTTATATSNNVTMTVTTPVTPTVSIAAVPGNSICSGTSVTFTATPTNGGTTPTYQWKVNGSNVIGTGNQYTSTTLSNTDVVSCVMTSSLTCVTTSTANSNNITMTVTTPVTPSVSITVTPSNNICAGTSVTFTATPTNGGTTPAYQWKVNGSNVTGTGNQFTSTTLSNNDIVTCEMTSSLTCVTTSTATSNSITMTVGTNLTPSVSIVAIPGNNICAGTSVTFTATATNGGTTPTYQWKVNGSNVTGTGNQYTSSTLSNNDIVTCEMTSSLTCVTTATATSNSVTMIVTPNVTPSITIAANPGNTICAGTAVTFTATPTNGGANPIYKWKLNGLDVGTNSTTYVSSTLANGDIVSCEMLSSVTCVTTNSATSNNITMSVSPNLTPAVSISALPSNAVCAGTSVTFTATPTNGGTTPTYQWKVNGNNVTGTGNQYTSTTLSNNDVVTCVMTSSETCVTSSTATSTGITMSVTPNLTPTISISASTTTICAGTSVTFTANATNGGATPTYQWKVNSVNVGTGGTTYTSSALSNGDVVSCELTSSIVCVTSTTANSNNITMTVNPNLTPAVSIAAGPNDTVCAGTTVTFTATPTNGGAAPRYQWKLNNVLTGANSPTYVLNNPSDGDVMSCELTSNATCVTTILANSSNLTLKVNQNLTPSVSITVTPNDTICAGASVTFTATPTNGGTTPTYQWKVNGSNVTGTGNQYTSSTLSNNDVVTCVMTSSELCVTSATATSNGITMTVNPNLTPTVTTTVSPNDTICAGTMTTFTATPVGGGSAPAYQWKLNGANVGTNSNTYSTSTLATGDVITVVLTSNSTCLATPTGTSAGITMTVNPNLTPDVSIAVSPNDTICTNETATFTATPTNGGNTPAYQWRVNGNNVGTNAITYVTSTLANSDVVDCILTSSEACVTRSKDTSTSINMFVRPQVTPSVTILANTGTTICNGSQVDFSSTFTGGGSAQTYQWRLNGVDITGAIASTYVTNGLSTGDIVSLRMDITDFCPAPDSALSNTLNMTVVTPTIDVVVAPNDTICDNESAMFSLNTSNVGNQPIYQWSVNGIDMIGAVSDVYTMATVTNGDIITTRFVSSNNCVNTPAISANNSINMVVNTTAPVTAGITANPGSVFKPGDAIWFSSTTNAPNASYQWIKNGVEIAGATGITYNELNPADGDSISLRVMTTDSCRMPNTSISNIIVLSAATSVKSIDQLFNKVSIAPNPNNGQFVLSGKISMNSPNNTIKVDIINALGAVVYSDNIKIERGEFKHHVDLGDIADGGLHIVRLHANGGVHYVKFVTSDR